MDFSGFKHGIRRIAVQFVSNEASVSRLSISTRSDEHQGLLQDISPARSLIASLRLLSPLLMYPPLSVPFSCCGRRKQLLQPLRRQQWLGGGGERSARPPLPRSLPPATLCTLAWRLAWVVATRGAPYLESTVHLSRAPPVFFFMVGAFRFRFVRFMYQTRGGYRRAFHLRRRGKTVPRLLQLRYATT